MAISNWISSNTMGTTATTTDVIWVSWTSNTTNTLTIQDNVWGTWQNSTASWDTLYAQRYVNPYANETDQERTARLEREEHARAQYARKARRAKIRYEIATIRAQRLLESLLTEEQVEEYAETKAFRVEVHDPRSRRFRSFRVNHGRAGNVTELDEDGRATYKYCVHLHGQEPVEDTMTAQLLMLQTDIAEFERLANRSRAYA